MTERELELEETIAGLETEILRLHGVVSLLYHFHEVVLKNFEVNNKNMIGMMTNFIPERR